MNAQPNLPLDAHERLRLIRDSLINKSSYLVSGLVGIILVPLLLRGLGAELYGLWIAALAVASVMQVVDFGLGLSVAREVAAASSGLGREAAARFVAAAGNAYLFLGLFGGLLLIPRRTAAEQRVAALAAGANNRSLRFRPGRRGFRR